MKQVMFFAHDAGGANAIAPLIPEFDNPLIFGKGPALNIMPNAKELSGGIIRNSNPDFLITGTSGNDFTERNLWREAEDLGITSMAILDSWINYGVRFSDYGLKELHRFDRKCNRLPNFICVMDEIAKKDMIKDGVPGEKIVTFGNPHFEKTASFAKDSTKYENQLTNNRMILFISSAFEDILYKGSDETVLQYLIQIVEMYDDATILIRKHPNETADKFYYYLNEHILMDSNLDVYDSIRQADIIVSVNSMVLIEALFFRKKIISCQPKTKNGKNDFILTRNNTLPFIDNLSEFGRYFNELYYDKNYKLETNIIHAGIIDRIKIFVEKQINGQTCD